jgi:DNA-binding SARP family transcriptional activator
MLVLAPGRRLPSEVIADRLWPDLSPDRGRANLRIYAWALGDEPVVFYDMDPKAPTA